jgi:hypothetical protein
MDNGRWKMTTGLELRVDAGRSGLFLRFLCYLLSNYLPEFLNRK